MKCLWEGCGHYACPEAMTWCEQNGIDYVFGLAGTKPLARKVDEASDAVRTKRAVDNQAVVFSQFLNWRTNGDGFVFDADFGWDDAPRARRP